MKPTAWRFTCSTARHRAGYDFITLDAKGDKAEAMKAARAAGWKPCAETMGSSPRSLLSWWCPECVARFTSAPRATRVSRR